MRHKLRCDPVTQNKQPNRPVNTRRFDFGPSHLKSRSAFKTDILHGLIWRKEVEALKLERTEPEHVIHVFLFWHGANLLKMGGKL